MTDAAPLNDAPSAELVAALRDQAFEAILETSDMAASYARSLGEAAYRGDELTMVAHIKQLRLCTTSLIGTFPWRGAMPMEQAQYDLNALLACCRRRVSYLEWIVKSANEGTKKHAEASRDLELMRTCCEFFVDSIFRSVTGQPPPPAKPKGQTP
jgi:hypothetical protein